MNKYVLVQSYSVLHLMRMNIWRIIFVVFCMDLIQLQTATQSFGDVNYDLRKLVAENTKMIRSLTEKLNVQSRRVTTLEEKLSKSEEEKLILVQRMESLESRVLDCGLKQNGEETPASLTNTTLITNSDVKSLNRTEIQKTLIRRATTGVVAFYAYMSHTESNPGPHHTIIFDVPVTNLGNGYNHFSGIFTVPISGVYVFSWTIADSPEGYVFSELVVDADVVGCILTQTLTDRDRLSTTGLVVKEVREGDVVYVRTSTTGGIQGNIESLAPAQRTSFSGWKLS